MDPWKPVIDQWLAEDETRPIQRQPNEMRGTDGVRILTVEDGWVWLFSAVEHWNGECVGWHACKRGDRYAALEPISQELKRITVLDPEALERVIRGDL